MNVPVTSSIRAFLTWEENQERKYEFADGEISLFPGETNRHGTIVMNVASGLRSRGLSAGTVYVETRTATARSSRYPDIAVTLDRRDMPEQTVLRFPKLVVEVLSASTEHIDKDSKFAEYRSIETLEEYVLVDSRKRWCQAFRLVADRWVENLPITRGSIDFTSVPASIPFDEAYAGTGL